MQGFLTRFCIPFSIPAITLVLICRLYTDNTVLALAAAGLFVLTAAYRPSRFKSAMALYAIAFGTLGEYLCCRVHFWVYAHPTALGLPAWIPFIWPILLINMWEVSTFILERLERAPGRLERFLSAALAAAIMAYAIYLSVFLHNMVAWILLGFLVLVLFFSRKPINAWLFAAVAAGGFFGEYMCVRTGVWFYTRPVLESIGMPVSLPMAWGVSANVVWLCADRLPLFGKTPKPENIEDSP